MVSAAIRYWVRLRTLVLVGLSCTLLGCGSGYAVLFSDGSSTAPPVEEDPPPPPTLIARDGTRLPLSLKDKTTKPMQIGLQDVPVPASLATVQVEVRALNGAAVDSPLTVYQASTKTVRFLYDVPNIRAELDRRLAEVRAGWNTPAPLRAAR